MKYFPRRYLLFVGIIGLILGVAFFGYARNDAKPIAAEFVYQLAAEGNDSGVVDKLRDVVWTQSSDIELLILFCESQFAMNKELSTCALSRDSSKQAVKFSNALWDIWVGRVKRAEEKFAELIADEQWRLWGEVGQLELARHTENYSEFASALDRLSNSSSKNQTSYNGLLEHYRFICAEETSNWQMLERLLNRYSKDEIAKSPALFSPQARLFYAQGRVAELGQMLDDVPEAFRSTTNYLLRKADYLSLVKGASAWSEFIEPSAQKAPENPRLFLEQAFNEVLHESPEVARTGFVKLHNFAMSSSADVRLLLGMAITLASYHKPAESEAIYRLIDPSSMGLESFTKFHVLVAWNAAYRGDSSVVHESLSRALSMAPTHQEANWLKVLIAKREKDEKAAHEALNILLAIDPNNKNYQSLARHFSFNR